MYLYSIILVAVILDFIVIRTIVCNKLAFHISLKFNWLEYVEYLTLHIL